MEIPPEIPPETPTLTRTQWINRIGTLRGLLAGRPDCDPNGVVKALFEREVAWFNAASEGGTFTTSDAEKAAGKAFEECVKSAAPSGAPTESEIPVVPIAIGIGAVALIGLVVAIAK